MGAFTCEFAADWLLWSIAFCGGSLNLPDWLLLLIVRMSSYAIKGGGRKKLQFFFLSDGIRGWIFVMFQKWWIHSTLMIGKFELGSCERAACYAALGVEICYIFFFLCPMRILRMTRG